MKRYAKIINQKTKEVQVGTSTNSKFYESIGMKIQDVEQAYNGSWFIKGYAPKKPESLIKEERIIELENYLKSTDWYAIRFADTDEEMPADIKKARQDAREEISKLKEQQ